MRTIKLIIEYDGTAYAGWQVQPNGLAVQEVLEQALSSMLKEKVRLSSSGRTDSGVHARGMVASFRTERTIPLRAFSDGLNTLLPQDIAIRDAQEAPPGFNPRRDAKWKHYRYTILNVARRSPLQRLVVWRVGGPLDLQAMERAARHFVGEKDYAAFRAANCAARTTVRCIDSLEISTMEETIIIDIVGSGFLKNMVRIIVGTLVEVGKGLRQPEEIPLLIEARDRCKAGITAPPQGLCLVEVIY